MSTRVSVLVAALVGVLGGAVIAGGSLVGASAQPTASKTESVSTASGSTVSSTKACGWRLKRLPAKLRADLSAARSLPVGQRRAAVRKIVKAARAGDYGKRAQRLLERRHELRRVVRSKLPATLRADLRKARHLPVGERRAALKEIRTKALAGDYGVKVQKFAQHRKERRAQCRPRSQAQPTA